MMLRRVIVIGASAGGVEALRGIVGHLTADLDAAVLVVLHTGATSPGVLPIILNRAGALRAAYATDLQPLTARRIFVAPPDHHLLVADGRVRVMRGPRENGFRPAVDPLFRTAANAYGAAVIGIVLSGALDDGTLGLLRIKNEGGVALVQDPDEAQASGMPLSAIKHVKIDRVATAAEIGALLVQLVESRKSRSGADVVRRALISDKLTHPGSTRAVAKRARRAGRG